MIYWAAVFPYHSDVAGDRFSGIAGTATNIAWFSSLSD
jgi:hypothetical protein